MSGTRSKSARLATDAVTGPWRKLIVEPEVQAAEERAIGAVEAMRRVYAEQAAAGIPGAVEGLERIERGLWPHREAGLPTSRSSIARVPDDG